MTAPRCCARGGGRSAARGGLRPGRRRRRRAPACAATQLARLATAGVPGRRPDAVVRHDATEHRRAAVGRRRARGHAVAVDAADAHRLPLRWLLERHGGSDGRDVRSAIGSLVHALVADPGKNEGQMVAELERLWAKLPFESAWYADNELARHRAMLSTFAQWREQTRRADRGGHRGRCRRCGRLRRTGRVRVRGRLDRLERDDAGPAGGRRHQDRQEPGQQGRCAAARAAGACTNSPSPKGFCRTARRPAAPAWSTSASRARAADRAAAGPADPDGRGEWRELVRSGGGRHPGAAVLARINDGCAHCPVRRTARPRPGDGTAHRDSRDYSPAELAAALGLFAPTDEQAAVIAAPPGPLVVIAGAGAGKTETMAARVVWLVANGYAPPGEVLGLTFTRKAAGKLLRRVRSRLRGSPAPASFPAASTRPTTRQRSAPTTPSPAPAARARLAAAGRARHPAAQRNRVVAVGVSGRHRASGRAGHRQDAGRRHHDGAAAGGSTGRAPRRHRAADRHPRRAGTAAHTLPAGPYQRDRGPSQWLLRMLATQTERTSWCR